MARGKPSSSKKPPPSTRRSQVQQNPTEVTESFPNGSQTLKSQAASSALPTEVVDSPFKRRGRYGEPPLSLQGDTMIPETTAMTPVIGSGNESDRSIPRLVVEKTPPVPRGRENPFSSPPDINPLDVLNTGSRSLSTPSAVESCPFPSLSPTSSLPPGLIGIEEETEHFDLDNTSDEDRATHAPTQARASTASKAAEPSSNANPSSLREPSQGKTTSSKTSKTKAKADDVHRFLLRPKEDPHQRHCVLCLHQKKSDPRRDVVRFGDSTSTSTIRMHFYQHHLPEWVRCCDELNIPITATAALERVTEYRLTQATDTDGAAQSSLDAERREFSKDAFVNAVMEWIVSDDQALLVIENKQLRSIFLMLRAELRDLDIPSRTTIKRRIEVAFEQHLRRLEVEMACAVGKISYTMDMWSDPNLSPYMGVTAHWIEGETVKTASGDYTSLKLRSELVGFVNVPTRHTGEHLAEAFLFVVSRLKALYKIGWITLDNASSNNTFAIALERELSRQGIPFSYAKRRIRCFPHIVNLACKAVLGAMTKMDYAKPTAESFTPPSGDDQDLESIGVLEAIQRDPIATLRSLIQAIRASSIRRQTFVNTQKTLNMKVLQLLCDVETRWSSTFLMVDRAIVLRAAIDKFLTGSEFADLRKLTIHAPEWKALELFREILKVPNAFQHLLAKEKTPTLGSALPAFESMKKTWQDMQIRLPNTRALIEPGLTKLAEYRNYADDNPTYILATVLNPRLKLQWFAENAPDKLRYAKDVILAEMRTYRQEDTSSSRHTHSDSESLHHQQAPDPNFDDAEEILGLRASVVRVLRTVEDELDAYLKEGLEICDLLRFWEQRRERFPTLYKLAMDILPIQASAVPCERVFSSSKQTIAAHRSRITPPLMEALQMLKYSVKHGHDLNFTEHFSRKEQEDQIEAEAASDACTPEDILSYRESLSS